ncbi:MAG: hypothetical protein KF884_06350 [Fimbriimonadaceae bacterium]|nr:hypothetical protein [Fimbriimonadaceae bacterium]QYK59705.1 MAG: hypothetical protein KF884_06350 [Fimbriimonadaceae bacterium]
MRSAPGFQTMNLNLQTILASVTASAVTSGVVLAGFVNLQEATPGTPQTGHINVTGTVRAGAVGIGAAPGTNKLQVTGTGATGGVRVNTQNGTGFFVSSNLTGANFITTGPAGRGVVGDSQATTGNGYGGVFATRTTGGGAGAFARAIGANNTSTGLIAENTSTTGIALVASNSGNNNGLESGTGSDSLLTKGAIPRHAYVPSTPAALAPLAYGSVGTSGAIASGSGNFTVARVSNGRYDIDVQGVSTIGTSVAIVAMPFETTGDEVCTLGTPTTGDFRIQVYNITGAALTDSNFSFIVFKPTGLLSPPAGLITPDMGSASDMEDWQRRDPAAFERYRRSFQQWEARAMASAPRTLPLAP